MKLYEEPGKKPCQEEDWGAEEHTGFDLQCADSLSIAINRIGEDPIGIKKLLLQCKSGAGSRPSSLSW